MARILFFCLIITLFAGISKSQDLPVASPLASDKGIALRFSIGSANTHWHHAFPDNYPLDSLGIQTDDGVTFYNKGTENHFLFEFLFTRRWGNMGLGFRASRMRIDSLEEVVNDTTLKFSYVEDSYDFNRIYLTYISPYFIEDKENKIKIAAQANLGTFIISPFTPGLVARGNLTTSIGPVIDIELTQHADIYFLFNYEFRYFNNQTNENNVVFQFDNFMHTLAFSFGVHFKLFQNQPVAPKKDKRFN